MSALDHIWMSHHLCYDPEAGRLVWAKPLGRRTVRGSLAGTPRPGGRRVVGLLNRYYPAETIAWALGHRRWPDAPVVAKNGNLSDLRLSNLTLLR